MSKASYIVLGGDGLEHGPLTAREIRRWIAHKRLERQSPVKTPGTKDWVFLESLPEFTSDLGLKSVPKSPPSSSPPPAPSAAAKPKSTRPVKGGPAGGSKGKVVILVLLLAAIAWLVWRQYYQIKPH